MSEPKCSAQAELVGCGLRAIREHLRLSRSDFAGAFNVHPGTIGRWERGDSCAPERVASGALLMKSIYDAHATEDSGDV